MYCAAPEAAWAADPTGIIFNYNRPNTEAPQVMMLVMPASSTGPVAMGGSGGCSEPRLLTWSFPRPLTMYAANVEQFVDGIAVPEVRNWLMQIWTNTAVQAK